MLAAYRSARAAATGRCDGARPLPSLRLALSRRSAIFGAVTIAAAVPRADAAPRWDADLVAPGARFGIVMDGARRALEPAPDDEREAHNNNRLDHANLILSRMAELDTATRSSSLQDDVCRHPPRGSSAT